MPNKTEPADYPQESLDNQTIGVMIQTGTLRGMYARPKNNYYSKLVVERYVVQTWTEDFGHWTDGPSEYYDAPGVAWERAHEITDWEHVQRRSAGTPPRVVRRIVTIEELVEDPPHPA